MTGKPTTIDEYLASVMADQRAALQRLRQADPGRCTRCRGVSGATVCLPSGRTALLVGFRAAANHCAFILMNGTTVAAFKKELADYDTSKGTIRFTSRHAAARGARAKAGEGAGCREHREEERPEPGNSVAVRATEEPSCPTDVRS